MKSYDVPLQENGRMILPRELRDMLGVGKGDRVLIRSEDGRLEITTAARSRDVAQARIKRRFPGATNVVETFSAERRAEAEREGDA